MESRILYNWYGHKFEPKIKDLNYDKKAYKAQVYNTYNRKKINFDLNKRINKNLFLRARTKINDDYKRKLRAIKISFKEQIKSSRDAIKDLQKINSLETIVNLEIKKSLRKKSEYKKIILNYYNYFKKSSDASDVKVKNIQELLATYQEQEKNEIAKLIYLHVLKDFYHKNKVGTGVTNEYLLNNKAISTILENKKFQDLKYDLETSKVLELDQIISQKMQSVLAAKKEQIAALEKNITLWEKDYLIAIQKLKDDTRTRKLRIEYDYNFKYTKQMERLKADKEVALKKIKQRQSDYHEGKTYKKEILQKVNPQIKTLEKTIQKDYHALRKLMFFSYFSHKKMQHLEAIFLVHPDFKDAALPLIHQQLMTEAKAYYLEGHGSNFQNLNHKFIEEYKKILQKTKSLEKNAQEKIKIYQKNLFSFIGDFVFLRNDLRFAKASYWEALGQSEAEFSYDGDYYKEKAQALKQYALDNQEIYQEFKKERFEAKKILLENQALRQQHHEEMKNVIHKHKSELKLDIKSARGEYRQKEISKQALKNKIARLKIDANQKLNDEKLKNVEFQSKSILKTQFIRMRAKNKIQRKIYESKVSEAHRLTPLDPKNKIVLYATLLNFFLPGMSEVVFFRQFRRAVPSLIITIIFYFLLMPFVFGFSPLNFGNGIFGLIDLGANTHDPLLGVFNDGRQFMFVGVVSIIILAAFLAYMVAAARNAFNISRKMHEGIRPSIWIDSKKEISKQRFPVLISAPGWFLIVFVVVVPVITSLLFSLTNIGFNHEPPGKIFSYVGFSQYGKWWLFRDNGLLLSISRVLGWTFLWTFASGFLVIIVGTFFAILVNNQRIRFKLLWRLIYIIPWAIPAFVTIIFLKSAFQSSQDSLINLLLLNLGIIDQPVDWFASPLRIRIILILLQTWLGHAYIFLLITGNIQSIPKDIYEAGSIDGASRWKLFRNLTVPALLAAIGPLLIVQFTTAFNNFTIISLFSGGGPAYVDATVFQEGTTDILISWIFKLANVVNIDGNQGFSAAMTTLASLISVAFASYGFAKSISRKDR